MFSSDDTGKYVSGDNTPEDNVFEDDASEAVENEDDVYEDEYIEGDAEDGIEEGDTEGDDMAGESDEEESIADHARWYVLHTYSGYENKVKANIEKIIENRGLHDYIQDIVVPMEEQIEIKDGKKKVKLRKVFPGYVLIKMVMTDETWYMVRNTRGVTGFVGPGSRPVPLSEEEIKAMGVEEFAPILDYEVGDSVRVISGPLENFIGTVEEINFEKKKVRAMISMFGRDTPVELELSQIQKL